MSRRKKIVCTAIFIIAVLGAYLWRDLHLGDNYSDVRIPDVVVENIEVEREISGKMWKFISPRVEHKDGVIYAQSLDITITESDDAQSKIYAADGVFYRESSNLSLNEAKGVYNKGDKSYTLASGVASYDAALELWSYTGGVELSDGAVVANAADGRYNMKNGDCLLSGDSMVRWNTK